MSNALRSLLSDYAEEARPYDVRARALATARRRKTRRRVAQLLALVLVLGVTGVVGLHFRGPGTAPILIPVDPERVTITGFPTRITRNPTASAMPDSGPVGEGVTIYHVPSSAGYGWFLVTANGSQYRLDARLPTALRYELSPDRRWLLTQPPGQPTKTVLRELTQPITVTLDLDGAALAWSPGGRWLALGPDQKDNPGVIRIVDLTQPTEPGQTVDLTGQSGMAVSGLLADGSVALVPRTSDGNLRLTIVNPQTGLVSGDVNVDLSEYRTDHLAQPDGTIGRRFIEPAADNLVFTEDNRVLLQTLEHGESSGTSTPMDPKDIILIDLATQKVIDLWVLPKPTVPKGISLCAVNCWRLLDMLPEGALLEHHTAGGTTSWEVYHQPTKQLFLVTELEDISATGK